jgi:hypothetical protein
MKERDRRKNNDLKFVIRGGVSAKCVGQWLFPIFQKIICPLILVMYSQQSLERIFQGFY